MSTEPEDATDAELLAEIEKEALKNANITATNNDTVPLNDSSSILNGTGGFATLDSSASANDNNAQLTQFQDSVITTGSDVSVLLMVILAILFLIQLIRKSHQYFTLQSKIKQVENPLDSARPMAAENLTPINPRYDHTAVAVYNTEYEDKKVFAQRQSDGAPPSVLKDILLKRAAKCVEKAEVLRRDGMGIRKNWVMDLVPKDVWDDFNAAQRNLQLEINSVAQENQGYQFNWGQPHATNIFSKAREEYQRKVFIQNKVMQQKMQQQRQAHQQQQGQGQMIPQQQQQQPQQAPASQQASSQQQQPPSKNAPSARAFGNGFTPGFFNSGNSGNANNSAADSGKKLSKKEKKELNKQKKQMKSGNTAAAANAGMQNGIGDDNAQQPQQQQQQVRRRKGKHRFANK